MIFINSYLFSALLIAVAPQLLERRSPTLVHGIIGRPGYGPCGPGGHGVLGIASNAVGAGRGVVRSVLGGPAPGCYVGGMMGIQGGMGYNGAFQEGMEHSRGVRGGMGQHSNSEFNEEFDEDEETQMRGYRKGNTQSGNGRPFRNTRNPENRMDNGMGGFRGMNDINNKGKNSVNPNSGIGARPRTAGSQASKFSENTNSEEELDESEDDDKPFPQNRDSFVTQRPMNKPGNNPDVPYFCSKIRDPSRVSVCNRGQKPSGSPAPGNKNALKPKSPINNNKNYIASQKSDTNNKMYQKIMGNTKAIPSLRGEDKPSNQRENARLPYKYNTNTATGVDNPTKTPDEQKPETSKIPSDSEKLDEPVTSEESDLFPISNVEAPQSSSETPNASVIPKDKHTVSNDVYNQKSLQR